MTTLDEYAAKATCRICAYGRPKVGKSALIAQLAKVFKLHWFDLEDGIKTALKPEILPREYWKNINVYPIFSNQLAPASVATLMKVVSGKECAICYTHGLVNCVYCSKTSGSIINKICLDTFTNDDMLVIDSTTQLSVDANFATNPIIRAAQNPEDFVLDKETGGKNFKYPMAVSFLLDRIFGTLQSKRVNLAVVSHEVMTELVKDTGKVVGMGENQPTMGGEMLFPACGSRNFSRSFGKYFDMLIHCEVVNRKHVAYSSTTHDTTSQSGSRIGNLEDIKNPKGEVLPAFEAIVELFKQARAHGNQTTSK